MCLRIKFCNHQRPGRAKFLKSLNPNPYVISLMPCLLYSKQNNTLIILNVHKRPCHSFSVKGHRRNLKKSASEMKVLPVHAPPSAPRSLHIDRNVSEL